jgi:hypothetical protein
MSLTSAGIVALDVLFAAAVLIAASCLVYLVSLTIREHVVLNAMRMSSRGAGPAPTMSNVARLADRRAARGVASGLRGGVARRGASASL